MSRQKNQGKRRDEIASATAQVIADRGGHNIRYADIAEQLGLTPGAIGYYFPTLDDLVMHAHSTAIERYHAQRVETTSRFEDPRDRLVAVIESGIPEGPDNTWRVLADATLTAMTSVPHAILLTSLVERHIALVCTILEIGVERGVFKLSGDMRRIARTMTHLIDEVGFETQLAYSATDPAEARAIVIEYASLATGVDLRARATARQAAGQ